MIKNYRFSFLFLQLFSVASCNLINDTTPIVEPNAVVGYLENTAVDNLFLGYDFENQYVEKVATVEDGKFRFEYELEEIVEARIFSKDPIMDVVKAGGGVISYPGLNIFLVPGEGVTVEGKYNDYMNAQVSGSIDNVYLNDLRTIDSDLRNRQWDLTRELYGTENLDSEKKKTLSGQLRNTTDELEALHLNFAYSMSDSYYSAALYFDRYFSSADTQLIDSLYNHLSPRVQQLYLGRKLKQKSADLKKSAIGAIAPDFRKISPDSTYTSLSDFRGKYVLLDFWGSWCIPCRKSHPHLREIYDNYKPYGFEILGIAVEKSDLEKSWKSWTRAIEQDTITWPQVLNEHEIERENLEDMYAVYYFPTKILLDPEGKVIFREHGISSSTQTIDSVLQVVFENK